MAQNLQSEFYFDLSKMVRRLRLKFIKEFGKCGSVVDRQVYLEIKAYLLQVKEAISKGDELQIWINDFIEKDIRYGDIPNREQFLLDNLLEEVKINGFIVDNWLRSK